MAGVTVLGAGAWGTALAIVLARNGQAVTLAVRRESQLAALRDLRENRAYLPAVPLPDEVRLEKMGAGCVRDSDIVIMAVPSRFARQAVAPLISAVPSEALVISVSKGIEP